MRAESREERCTLKAVDIRDLRFSYDGKREILRGVTFSVDKGEAVVLAGQSGCGKTTLCHCMCGVIPSAVSGHLSGSVAVDGADIGSLPLYRTAEHIGLVFQNPDDQLICQAVEDELAFGLENLCVESGEIRRRVNETMELFALTPLAETDTAHLSGGQKKLVTIASVFIMGPGIIVLDEPMTGLDADSRALVYEAIGSLRRSGRTVIAVEHDLSLASYADRIVYLRGGRIYDKP